MTDSVDRLTGANAAMQRLCIWSGVAYLVMMGTGLVVIARLIPPPLASDSAEQVRRMYIDHQTRIQIGLSIAILASGFMYSFAGGLATQIKRVEGRWSPLAMSTLASGMLLGILTYVPLMMMAAAAFRPAERSADVTQALHDLGWLTFVGAVASAFIWLFSVGLAILRDPRTQPCYPRWFGYLSIWCAFLNLPGITIIFFTRGPFSWHGIIAFYVPLIAFAVWYFLMIAYALKAITRQQEEEASSRLDKPGTGCAVSTVA